MKTRLDCSGPPSFVRTLIEQDNNEISITLLQLSQMIRLSLTIIYWFCD